MAPVLSARRRRRCVLALFPVIVAMAAGRPAALDAAEPVGSATLSPGRSFVESGGADLYANVCQGCHMRDGRGAVGAAAYPSLAANTDLRSPGFVVDVVLKGLKGMPPLGRSLTDDQVASLVNYVRTHFGNGYGDAVTGADVTAARN